MKSVWLTIVLGILVAVGGSTIPVEAAPDNYGAGAAALASDIELTVPTMLTFALQDEYLARGEYQKIMEKFGVRRPFSNIIKTEEQHIAWLIPLFEKHGATLPTDRGLELAQVPDTFAGSLQAGVEAEIANIKMYERFLTRELPTDVKGVFEHLLAASRNHLAAFSKGGGGQNR